MRVRHVSRLVNVKNTTPRSLYKVPSDRRVVLKKIMAYNKDADANTIILYDGDNQRLPAIPITGNYGLILGEDKIPNVEFYTEIKAALGTAGTNGVDIVVEVEEGAIDE